MMNPVSQMQNMRVICFNCKQKGHYANKCPLKANQQQQRNQQPATGLNREERLQTQFEQSLQQQEGRESGMDGVPMLQDNEAVDQEYGMHGDTNRNGVSVVPASDA